MITPRRYEVDERYADLLRRGEIVLQDVFREIVALGREPSPGCLWLYKVINYKVKSEHLVDLATFDKKRFSYREFCFDECSDLEKFFLEKIGKDKFQLKMEWQSGIPSY